MTSRKEVVEVIAKLIKNGINMDKSSFYECNLFMKELFEFINVSSHLNAHYSGNRITVESIFFDPLLFIELDKTTVQCIPITDEGWIDAVFEVIKFIHLKEEKQKEKKKKLENQIKKDDKEFDWV